MKYYSLLFSVLSYFCTLNAQTLDQDYFNNLKSQKVASSSNFEWRQFGPGNSGYCEEFWIHPTDPNCFYMSPDLSNSYGTFDNGDSWQTIKEIDGDGRGMRRVQSVNFSHQNPDFGFAINVRGFLFQTTNKGRSWTKVLELNQGRHSEMTVDPNNDNNWYIGAGDFWNVKGYHRSKATPQGNIGSFIAYGHIYRTDDKGNNWTPVIVDSKHINDLSVGIIIVDPSNSNNIIAGTNFGLYKSTDKGLSWSADSGTGLPHNLPRDMDIYVDRSNPRDIKRTLFLVEQTHYEPNGNTVTSSGGVYASTDFGATWNNITGNLGMLISSGANNANNTGIDSNVVVEKYYETIGFWLGINKTEAKSTYDRLPTNNVLPVFNRMVVNPTNPDEIYISYNVKHDFTFGTGDVWKTENGGANWFPCVRTGNYWRREKDKNYWDARNSPSTINTKFAHLEEELQTGEEFSGCRFLEINQLGEVFISIDQQTLKTTNNGSTWEQIDNIETSPGSKEWIGRGDSNMPGRFILLETGIPGRKLACTGEHGLWQTVPLDDSLTGKDDLSVAVKQIEGQVHERGATSISSVAVDPNDPNTIYTLQFRQNHRGYLRKTTDGGKNWDNVSFPFEGDYSGTNISLQHIFQYDLLIQPDMPERMFFTVMENPVAEVNADFRIVTRDADFGIRRSFDSGLTWVSSNNGLPNKPSVRRIAMNPSKPSQMYAALNISRNGDTDGGLYFSNNSAQLWSKVTIPASIKSVNNVFIDTHTNTNNLNDIFISCGTFNGNNANSGGVWKSSDDGATWNKIFDMPYVWQTETSPIDPNIITVSVPLQNDKRNNVVTLFNPGAYLSFDGGSTWEKISNNLGQPDLIVDLKPDNVDRNVFWLALKGSAWAKGIYRDETDALSTNDFIKNSTIKSIKLYPNPITNGSFTIESQNRIPKDSSVEIFDINGALISTEKTVSISDTKIKVANLNLAAGIYFVRITTNKTEYIKRFTIK